MWGAPPYYFCQRSGYRGILLTARLQTATVIHFSARGIKRYSFCGGEDDLIGFPKGPASVIEATFRFMAMALLFGLCAQIFMNHLSGSAMFCDDPPAGTPGWKWRVPAAWFVIYGVSGFVASWVANVAPRCRLMSVTLAACAICAVLTLRVQRFHGGFAQFLVQPEIPMGPLGLTIGMVAGSLLHKDRRTKAQNQPSQPIAGKPGSG
jgi:hypothetical protein